MSDFDQTTTQIHTVIFDLDGTLSDSGLLTTEAMQRLAPRFGLSAPGERAIRLAMGYATPEFYYRLFPDIPEEKAREFGDAIEREELRILPDVKSRLLFPGCAELLARLKGDGIRLYIASTGEPEHVYAVLRGTGIEAIFDRIECGRPDKVGMLCELTADREKSGYLMVGDMGKDSNGARANGIRSAGACFGYCDRERAEFDLYLDEPSDLSRLIHGLS